MILKLVILSLVGGLCGSLIGSGVGIVCSGGPCPILRSGWSGTGAIVGAGLMACIVLMQRPDPRACNRQDPPFPPAG